MKKARNILLLIAAVTGLHFLAEYATRGFRFYHLISNLPYDARWENPPLEAEALQEINSRLNQSFTFLGSGGWCMAFLGEDQKTVLKFFRHIDLYPQHIFRRFSWGKLLMQSPPDEASLYYFQHFNFNSCKLLFDHFPKQSAIRYLHLNKTDNLHPTITLYDPVGVAHTLDLNATEFVIQDRAELLMPYLDNLVTTEGIAATKNAIDAFLDCLLSFYSHGLRDDDHGLRNNFGFVGDQPVTIDLSSWVSDPTIQTPSHYKKEIILKTHRLSRWLNKYHPELSEHLDKRLFEILDNQFSYPSIQEDLTLS